MFLQTNKSQQQNKQSSSDNRQQQPSEKKIDPIEFMNSQVRLFGIGPQINNTTNQKSVESHTAGGAGQVQRKGAVTSGGLDPVEMMEGQARALGIDPQPMQMLAKEEEEKPVQGKVAQKQGREEEEKQLKPIQKQEEEEEVQAKLVQKQEEEELQAKLQQKPEEEEKQLKKSSDSEPSGTKGGSGSTTSMPEDVQAKMENSFGTSFSGVNIHQNDNSATEMGALAYTQGDNVHFAPGQYNPASSKGQELLGHELTHVVQQRQGRVQPTKQGKGMSVNDSPSLEQEADVMGKKAAEGKNNHLPINRRAFNGIQKKEAIIQKLSVDDITEEMNGQKFILVKAFGSIPKGTEVTITDWNGTNGEAVAEYSDGTKKTSVTLSKGLLTPKYTTVAGVTKYEVGLEGQRNALSRSQSKIDDWKAQEGAYKKNRTLWESELKRLEDLHTKREKVMSQMLIRETMYNRFDKFIKKWVDYYNSKYKPASKLEPNIIKSIIFQETRMGTSGVHLEKPPYDYKGNPHPIKSRFNLGQVIDSFGPQQYLMIKEMAPTIYTAYGFDAYEAKAKWKGMTPSEWLTPNFLKAIEAFSTFKNSSGENLMGNDNDLFLDYEFWIRATVKWIFQKYFITKSWSAAVKAYNGGGSKAESYKKSVVARAAKKPTVLVGNK